MQQKLKPVKAFLPAVEATLEVHLLRLTCLKLLLHSSDSYFSVAVRDLCGRFVPWKASLICQ